MWCRYFRILFYGIVVDFHDISRYFKGLLFIILFWGNTVVITFGIRADFVPDQTRDGDFMGFDFKRFKCFSKYFWATWAFKK